MNDICFLCDREMPTERYGVAVTDDWDKRKTYIGHKECIDVFIENIHLIKKKKKSLNDINEMLGELRVGETYL